MKDQVLGYGSFLNIDETWTKVRVKYAGDETKLGKYYKKYIWVVINKIKRVAYFLYDNDENDRGGRRPIEKFLGDFKSSYNQMIIQYISI